MVKEKVKEKAKEKTAPARSKVPIRDIVLIAATLAVVMIAGSVIYHVYRNTQPNIISRPASGKSGKALWLEEQKRASPSHNKSVP